MTEVTWKGQVMDTICSWGAELVFAICYWSSTEQASGLLSVAISSSIKSVMVLLT